jgi:hypothetical protein
LNSTQVVESLCVGKTSCSVFASDTVFGGEPCAPCGAGGRTGDHGCLAQTLATAQRRLSPSRRWAAPR